MSGLPYLAALIGIGVVIYWYLREETVHGGSGKRGILGIRDRREERQQREDRAPDWRTKKDAKPWRPSRH